MNTIAMKKNEIGKWLNERSRLFTWLDPEQPFTRGEVIACAVVTALLMLLIGVAGHYEYTELMREGLQP